MIPHILALTLLSTCIAVGQSPATAPAFEVASVRPHPGPLHVIMGFNSSGPRLTLEAYSPIQLVTEAYGLKGYQVSVAPSLKLQDTIFYDIAAKAEGDATLTRADFRPMLQTLLAQRFNLKCHFENREMPVYALTVARNGPKFKPSAPNATGPGHVGVNGRNQTVTSPLESMEDLVEDIAHSFFLDRPIVDRTALTGTYDIHLEATPEFRINHDSGSEDVSIFTAVQEQLGLKLESAKAPVQVLIIDHIESPTPN
jgi:uncharacterized protein (TIGR03435 family)